MSRRGLDLTVWLRALGLALGVLSACEAPLSSAPAQLDLDDDREALGALLHPERGIDRTVVRAMAGSRRMEFVPVLVELLRFHDSGAAGVPEALGALTGKSFGHDWSAWVEWLGDQNIPIPKGFDAWKADLMARIDPNFRSLLYAGVPTRIKLEEIVWGGVCKDCIPALVNPTFIPAGEASFLQGPELVFGLAINGDERAYPHRILDWHEMANDVVGGVPVALAY